MRKNDKVGGCFYFCAPFKNFVNCWFKPGTFGGMDPSHRMANLRRGHGNIEMKCYIPMPMATKAEYEAVEHHTKMILLRRFPELTHMGNDHFSFKTSKEEYRAELEEYRVATMEIAIEYCDSYGIPHDEIVWPTIRKGGVHYGKRK
jgi:hypothetical protein